MQEKYIFKTSDLNRAVPLLLKGPKFSLIFQYLIRLISFKHRSLLQNTTRIVCLLPYIIIVHEQLYYKMHTMHENNNDQI